MEREIKFRGMTTDKKEWVYGYLERGTHWQSKKEILLIQHSLIESTQIIPKSVGQYTGLKDKNGKDIYEGDILRILERDWCSQSDNKLSSEEYMKSISSISQVIWSDGRFKLIPIIQKTNHSEYVGDNSRRDIFEVIGNKFQNPELLK